MKYTTLSWLTAFVWLAAATAHAQPLGTCAPAEAYLDVNNVRARIFNNGALFWNGGPFVYEVPKGSGHHALFYVNVMVAGRVGGTPRAAASMYATRRREFWPGPLDEAGRSSANCDTYDRLFEITRTDIETVNETGEKSPNLLDWPWDLGAPVLDGDGDPDNYNLDGGDRPALMGDQMIWWVMNDAGGVHKETGSPPLGLEVHGTAFAFSRHTRSLFNNTTFYRYVLLLDAL